MVFEQSLSGLIKALRANKRDEQKVIESALAEIRIEVRSKDWDVKAAAVLKLTYLEMLGHPTLLQHSFPVIECMASPKFHIKQIGYLAASQSFGESTQVILLTHNLIKKDLQSSAHPSTVILALTSLPTLLSASPQLADDLLQDLLRMLTHSKAQVRRIATLVIGKIWASQHSVALEFNHVEKLRTGLNDEDATVISATVNVMLELARSRKDALPSLLGLAPELFDLLTNSTNNWMLIKIVKLFAILTPIEPRLVRKLLPPLSNLISTTPAFSLLYECIQTVIIGGMLSSPSSEATSLATTCIDKLSSFLSDADQNLRYIALKGLSRLMNTHAYLLSNHHDEILKCIDEEDFTIRLKALELVERLTERSNCKEVVRRLLAQISPSSATKGKTSSDPARKSAAAALRAISSNYDKSSPSGLAVTDSDTTIESASFSTSNTALSNYRYRLLIIILRITSRSSEDGSQLYVNISNFEWYIDILVTVSYLSLSIHPSSSVLENNTSSLGSMIASSLLDVTARAASVRQFTVKKLKKLIEDDSGFLEKGTNGTISSILAAAAFIVSEHASLEECRDLAGILFKKALNNEGPLDIYREDMILCGIKCLARWMHSLVDSFNEATLPGIKAELQDFINLLEGDSRTETQYSSILRLVYKGLDGPRMAASSSRKESANVPEGIEGATPKADENEGDPSHNPFASSAPSQSQQAEDNQDPALGPPVALSLLHSIFFAYELRPLANGAQAAVVVPEALDLDSWTGQPLDDDSLLYAELEEASGALKGDVDEYGRPRAPPAPQEKGRYVESESGTGKKKTKKSSSRKKEQHDDIDSIPIVKLDLTGLDDDETSVAGPSTLSNRTEEGKKLKKSKRKEEKEEVPRQRTPSPPPLILSAGGDMPSSSPARASKAPSPAPPLPVPSSATTLNQVNQDEKVHIPAEAVKVIKVKKKKTKEGTLDDKKGASRKSKSKGDTKDEKSKNEGNNLVSL